MGRSPLPSPPYVTRAYWRDGDAGTRCTTPGVTSTSLNRRHAVSVAVGEFGPALRAWRDRLAPEDLGLPADTRRRAPGLRRQEVARPAGVSVDYIIQLGQGRAAEPSEQVLRSAVGPKHERPPLLTRTSASPAAAASRAASWSTLRSAVTNRHHGRGRRRSVTRATAGRSLMLGDSLMTAP